MPRDRYPKTAAETAARPASGRGWRGNMKGRPPETLESPSLKEDPSDVYVEGRAFVVNWDGPKRAALGRLVAAANAFGLHVHEVPPESRGARKSWSYQRVDLDAVAAAIEAKPGIFFDDLVDLWMAFADQKTFATRKAARAKASVAVSRLAADYRIVKRKNPEDGRLTLYLTGAEPERGASS